MNVVITPADTSITPVTVAVSVIAPTSLGTTQAGFDAHIIDLAHRFGIPPQYLKAQVQQESGFNRSAYRNEVLSKDFEEVSGGAQLRTQNPYSLYRLATSDGLTQGTQILTADLSPRSVFNIMRPMSCVPSRIRIRWSQPGRSTSGMMAFSIGAGTAVYDA